MTLLIFTPSPFGVKDYTSEKIANYLEYKIQITSYFIFITLANLLSDAFFLYFQHWHSFNLVFSFDNT